MSIAGVGAMSSFDAWRLQSPPEPTPREQRILDIEEQARELWRQLKAKIELLDAYRDGDGVDFITFDEFFDLAKGRRFLTKRKDRT